jgi:hypothetical protein
LVYKYLIHQIRRTSEDFVVFRNELLKSGLNILDNAYEFQDQSKNEPLQPQMLESFMNCIIENVGDELLTTEIIWNFLDDSPTISQMNRCRISYLMKKVNLPNN